MAHFFFRTLVIVAFLPAFLDAQTIQLNAPDLIPKSEVYFSPRTGSFVENSVFEVPILINTQGSSINAIELTVRFDPAKLSIVNPSGGKSVIGVWVEPPSFDNTRGTARFVGVIPGGIRTDAGLIATITFRARTTGATNLRFASDSQILLNDGFGTAANTTLGRADYTIIAKPPEGVAVYSETHPSDRWYNNNSPVFSWDASPESDGYSFHFDNSPLTVPENKVISSSTRHALTNLPDGVWFFHLKAQKGGMWGNSTHYQIKIDTAAPAEFTPRVDYIMASSTSYRGLVTFKTTDLLSGIDHYEVGVLDIGDESSSPIFIQAESPYQVPATADQVRVIVRAFDAAGNTRDATIDVDLNSWFALFVRNSWNIGLASILMVLLALIGVHYLIRHHVLRHLRDAYALFRREQKDDEDDQSPPSSPIVSQNPPRY